MAVVLSRSQCINRCSLIPMTNDANTTNQTQQWLIHIIWGILYSRDFAEHQQRNGKHVHHLLNSLGIYIAIGFIIRMEETCGSKCSVFWWVIVADFESSVPELHASSKMTASSLVEDKRGLGVTACVRSYLMAQYEYMAHWYSTEKNTNLVVWYHLSCSFIRTRCHQRTRLYLWSIVVTVFVWLVAVTGHQTASKQYLNRELQFPYSCGIKWIRVFQNSLIEFILILPLHTCYIYSLSYYFDYIWFQRQRYLRQTSLCHRLLVLGYDMSLVIFPSLTITFTSISHRNLASTIPSQNSTTKAYGMHSNSV